MGSDAVSQLRQQLRRALEADIRDTASLLELAPPTETGLTPWMVWMLLYLVRHHARQNWVAAVVRDRLEGDLLALAALGAIAHPDRPSRGLVPGDQQWEYYFHGGGCCLTHRGTGESIDVDFYDETGAWFDEFFVHNHLTSLKSPGFVEERVRQLQSSTEVFRLALQALLSAGVLEKHAERHVVRLAFDPDALLDLLAVLERRWNESAVRLQVAIAVGDWMLAETIPASPELMAIVSKRADECRHERTAWLTQLWDDDDQRRLVLAALDELRSPVLDDYLRKALAGPFCGTTSVAMKIIARRNDAQWIDPVQALLNRLNPAGEIPQAHLYERCLDFLLRHGRSERQIRKKLSAAGPRALGESAVLALEYAPELAVDLFRRALRSSVPHDRIVAAAVLAILDQEWSQEELLSVLEESDEQRPTAECRAALRESRSPDMHARVRLWEERNPHEPERGPYLTMDEWSLQSCQASISYEMQKWHDRVLPLRKVTPPELRRRWWPWAGR